MRCNSDFSVATYCLFLYHRQEYGFSRRVYPRGGLPYIRGGTQGVVLHMQRQDSWVLRGPGDHVSGLALVRAWYRRQYHVLFHLRSGHRLQPAVQGLRLVFQGGLSQLASVLRHQRGPIQRRSRKLYRWEEVAITYNITIYVDRENCRRRHLARTRMRNV